MHNSTEHLSELSFFENQLDYSFKNKDFLIQAFTSKGFSNENRGVPYCDSLAALGDGIIRVLAVQRAIVLGYSIKEDINDFSKKFADGSNQGELLWMAFTSFNVEEKVILRLGKGEYKLLSSDDHSFLEQFFEALIGALYLDSNIDETRRIFVHLINQYISYSQLWHHGF